MRILLLESEPGVGAETSASLVDQGHEVLRCHEPGSDTFPCREVEAPGTCPLLGRPAVDCAVVVHQGDEEQPTYAEAGVSCAIRRGVPVVQRHEGHRSPFTGCAIPVGSSGVSAACELAIDAARAHEVRPLAVEVERLLAAAGAPTFGIHVDIARDVDQTRISVAVPSGTPIDHGAIATRVLARYTERSHPDDAGVVNVDVHELPPRSAR
jgi:hypothetical protein